LCDRRPPPNREWLVERFLPLARKLARRYQHGADSLEDLVQVASLGLVKAARRFDETRGVSFGTYAAYSINGELMRHLRDHTWALHVPRSVKDRALEVNRAIRAAEQAGDMPSARELAERLEMSEQEVLDAREAWLALEAESLDGPVCRSGESEPEALSETVGSLDDGYELADQRFTLTAAWRKLPVRERRVMYMRFIEDQRQQDIATRLGVSQMQVSRLLKSALERLELGAGQSEARPTRLSPARAVVKTEAHAARPAKDGCLVVGAVEDGESPGCRAAGSAG
jgi:RNA polymerase sigma-B factor